MNLQLTAAAVAALLLAAPARAMDPA